MRLVTIGDSITKGTYTAEGEKGPGSIAKPNFAELLKQKLGFDELINYGVNGVSISSCTQQLPQYAIVKTTKNMESGDIILLAAGTNDYGTHVPLGKIEDRTEDTFYGALFSLFVRLVFSVLNGSEHFLALEYQSEIVCRGKSAQLGNFFYAFFCIDKKLFRFGNAQGDKKVYQGTIHMLFKGVHQRALGNKEMLGDLVERLLFRVVLVEVVDNF